MKEVVEDFTEEMNYSNDSDARVGHKSVDTSFFSYKTHLAMSDERIITAAVVTTGEKGDGKMAISKSIQHRKDRNTSMRYSFDVNKCKVCPIREGCYKEGTKTKTYHVTIKSTEYTEQEHFQNTEEFKVLSKSRYKIEAKIVN